MLRCTGWHVQTSIAGVNHLKCAHVLIILPIYIVTNLTIEKGLVFFMYLWIHSIDCQYKCITLLWWGGGSLAAGVWARCEVFLLLEKSWYASKYLGSIKGMRGALLGKHDWRTPRGSSGQESVLCHWGWRSSIRNLCSHSCSWLADWVASGHIWRNESSSAWRFTGLDWVFHPFLKGWAQYLFHHYIRMWIYCINVRAQKHFMLGLCLKVVWSSVVHVFVFKIFNLWSFSVRFHSCCSMKLVIQSLSLLESEKSQALMWLGKYYIWSL